jgi:hypothetical protein
MCWPANTTGAPWNKRNLYLPDSLPKAMTEPLKVMAPMAAPKNSSKRLPLGMSSVPIALATMPNACGSTTAAMAMNTAARPIMLCMKATSSGILVISTRCAMMAPAPPPMTTERTQHVDHTAQPVGQLDDQRSGGGHGNRHADSCQTGCRGSRWSGDSGLSAPG